MKLAYCLNQSLSLDKLIGDLKKVLSKIPQEDIENSVLTISLVKIVTPAPNLPPPIIEGSGTLSQPN